MTSRGSPDGFAKPSAALHAAFVLSGIVTVVLGPLIPEASRRWGLPPSRVGELFLAQFIASSVGAAISSRRARRSAVGGYALIAAGLAVVATGSFPAARFGMALVGLGLGLSIPATNLMVAQRHPGRRGAALSHLNLMWGAGAVLSPLLFMALPPWARVEGVLLPLAATAGLTSIGLAVLLPADPPRVIAGEGMGAGVSGGLLALSAVQLLLAVGTETAVGGWIVAVYPAGGPVPALLVGGGFWAAFLAGRAVAPVLLRRWSESALHAGALALAGLGAAVVLWGGSATAVAAGALLAGLGLAPVFPLVVAPLTALIEVSRSRHAGSVFAVCGLGGATLPWLTGRVGETMGALRYGFAVPLSAIVVMGLLLGLHHLLSARGSLPRPRRRLPSKALSRGRVPLRAHRRRRLRVSGAPALPQGA